MVSHPLPTQTFPHDSKEPSQSLKKSKIVLKGLPVEERLVNPHAAPIAGQLTDACVQREDLWSFAYTGRMNSPPKVVVIGAGAVGGYFGGKLALAGAGLTLVGRPGGGSPHMEALAREGLRIEANELEETIPVDVTDDASVVGRADLVLFAVKTLDTVAAARSIAPHLLPNTIVVSLQNGVDNVERMAEGGVDALAAVVYVAAAIERPGVVSHHGRGDLVLGHATRGDEVRRVAGWFEAAGVPVRVSGQIEAELWSKLVINAMANAISALTGAPYARVAAHSPSMAVAMDVASEAFAVARAAGIELDEEAVTAEAGTIYVSMSEATSSTQQDIARGKPTEIDSLNGLITRKGEALGVPTPVNRALWALVSLREQIDAR